MPLTMLKYTRLQIQNLKNSKHTSERNHRRCRTIALFSHRRFTMGVNARACAPGFCIGLFNYQRNVFSITLSSSHLLRLNMVSLDASSFGYVSIAIYRFSQTVSIYSNIVCESAMDGHISTRNINC